MVATSSMYRISPRNHTSTSNSMSPLPRGSITPSPPHRITSRRHGGSASPQRRGGRNARTSPPCTSAAPSPHRSQLAESVLPHGTASAAAQRPPLSTPLLGEFGRRHCPLTAAGAPPHGLSWSSPAGSLKAKGSDTQSSPHAQYESPQAFARPEITARIPPASFPSTTLTSPSPAL